MADGTFIFGKQDVGALADRLQPLTLAPGAADVRARAQVERFCRGFSHWARLRGRPDFVHWLCDPIAEGHGASATRPRRPQGPAWTAQRRPGLQRVIRHRADNRDVEVRIAEFAGERSGKDSREHSYKM